jgi:hypothetical protein
VSAQARGALRGAIAHVTEVARAVLTGMHEIGSSGSLYTASRLGWIFRDGLAAAQHVNLKPAGYEIAGRVLLDQPPDVPFI